VAMLFSTLFGSEVTMLKVFQFFLRFLIAIANAIEIQFSI